MDPTSFSGGLAGSGPIRPSADGAQSSGGASRSESLESPAFRALLEQLEEKAQALGSQSLAVDGPEALGQAVDDARSSLEEALSIGDRLLDAYRESIQRGSASAEGGGAVQPSGEGTAS